MTMTRASLVQRAWLKNQAVSGAADIPLARYDVLEPQARAIMAQKIAVDPSERIRAQLRKDFSLSVASGVVSLTTVMTASEPLIDQALDRALITSTDSSYPWQYMDYTLLTLERPAFGLIYYGVKSGNLHATDTTGVLGSLTTTATCNCGYVPLAATLSGDLTLEELAVASLAELAMSGGVAQAA